MSVKFKLALSLSLVSFFLAALIGVILLYSYTQANDRKYREQLDAVLIKDGERLSEYSQNREREIHTLASWSSFLTQQPQTAKTKTLEYLLDQELPHIFDLTYLYSIEWIAPSQNKMIRLVNEDDEMVRYHQSFSIDPHYQQLVQNRNNPFTGQDLIAGKHYLKNLMTSEKANEFAAFFKVLCLYEDLTSGELGAFIIQYVMPHDFISPDPHIDVWIAADPIDPSPETPYSKVYQETVFSLELEENEKAGAKAGFDEEITVHILRSYNLAMIEAESHFLIQISVLTSFGLAVIGFLFALELSRRFVKPLSHLLTGVQAITQGDLNQTVFVEPGRYNEFGILGNAFNNMSASLASSYQELNVANKTIQAKNQELEAYSENLEGMVKERTEEITHLNKVAQAVNTTLKLDEVMATAMERLQQVFNFDQLGILLTQDNNQTLVVTNVYGAGVTPEQSQTGVGCHIPLRKEITVLAHAVVHNEPIYLPSITPEIFDTFLPKDQEVWHIFETQGFLFCPLEVQHQVIGLICFGNSKNEFILHQDDIQRIQRYVTHIATAVNNARLYKDLKTMRIQLVESEKISAMTQTFEKFVPKQFLHRLATEGIENIKLGKAESDVITILFSDIRSFTHLSESMSPQEVLNFLNAYFQRMSQTIHDHDGFIDKFVGDAIMALFDLPEEENALEARNAINASISMQNAVTAYNRDRQVAGYPPISIGIGIHSGPVVIGTVGSQDRMDSTVLGDVVNLAARLEELTKYYSSKILVSEETFRMTRDTGTILWRELDYISVRGKDIPTKIYEVFNCDPAEVRERKQQISESYHRGITAFYGQRWDEALHLFQMCLQVYPEDVASRLYVDRCLHPEKEISLTDGRGFPCPSQQSR